MILPLREDREQADATASRRRTPLSLYTSVVTQLMGAGDGDLEVGVLLNMCDRETGFLCVHTCNNQKVSPQEAVPLKT